MPQPTPSPEPPAPRRPADPRTPDPAPAAAAAHPSPPDGGVQPIGPVGAVPGPAPAAPPPAPAVPPRARRTATAPARRPRTPRPPQVRAARVGAGLAALSLLLLQGGLLTGAGGVPLWTAAPLWSASATLATLAGVVPFAGRLLPAVRRRPDAAWQVAAAGLTGTAVFWVLVVLPRVDTDRGFVLTAALAALGAALWVAPGRDGG
ncbi:hypothetical protein SAMN06893096_105112 [Geodermatophilus pulveris]|uniref:Uncharacterized protein n=1 Tax=Geodermatophilus pulveris TaxID=1564159 RepID=A0A239FJT6_9ACTN|nr:hypothetical protein [Geodermatophilus pulveris]SNS56818.1 hypothetical protein SAMN06893096_105112 [Geodermatophilus pulveris]